MSILALYRLLFRR